MKLSVEYVPIGSVKEYANNAKLHPAEQIQQIKESIKQFGDCDPIGVWHDPKKDEDVIVEGHGRYRALLEMGETEIPIIRLDHLTDEQRKAYALVHNKLTMNSDFDTDTLLGELDEILDIDMSEFGFGADDFIDDLLENEFSENGGGNTTFALTLNLPIDDKEDSDEFCRRNGKAPLEKAVLELIREEGQDA